MTKPAFITGLSTLAVTLLAACLLCGCRVEVPGVKGIRQADTLTLYEGLPHQLYEEDTLEAEKKSKPTLEIHGFPFYAETLELSAADAEELKTLLGRETTYRPFSGEKKCGGFHPDYAIQWSAGNDNYTCLVCFGCGELILVGPEGESRHDIGREASGPLRKVLKPYMKNRPLHEGVGA